MPLQRSEESGRRPALSYCCASQPPLSVPEGMKAARGLAGTAVVKATGTPLQESNAQPLSLPLPPRPLSTPQRQHVDHSSFTPSQSDSHSRGGSSDEGGGYYGSKENRAVSEQPQHSTQQKQGQLTSAEFATPNKRALPRLSSTGRPSLGHQRVPLPISSPASLPSALASPLFSQPPSSPLCASVSIPASSMAATSALSTPRGASTMLATLLQGQRAQLPSPVDAVDNGGLVDCDSTSGRDGGNSSLHTFHRQLLCWEDRLSEWKRAEEERIQQRFRRLVQQKQQWQQHVQQHSQRMEQREQRLRKREQETDERLRHTRDDTAREDCAKCKTMRSKQAEDHSEVEARLARDTAEVEARAAADERRLSEARRAEAALQAREAAAVQRDEQLNQRERAVEAALNRCTSEMDEVKQQAKVFVATLLNSQHTVPQQHSTREPSTIRAFTSPCTAAAATAAGNAIFGAATVIPSGTVPSTAAGTTASPMSSRLAAVCAREVAVSARDSELSTALAENEQLMAERERAVRLVSCEADQQRQAVAAWREELRVWEERLSRREADWARKDSQLSQFLHVFSADQRTAEQEASHGATGVNGIDGTAGSDNGDKDATHVDGVDNALDAHDRRGVELFGVQWRQLDEADELCDSVGLLDEHDDRVCDAWDGDELGDEAGCDSLCASLTSVEEEQIVEGHHLPHCV